MARGLTVQGVIEHLQQLVATKPDLADQLFILRRPAYYGDTQEDEIDGEDFQESTYYWTDYGNPDPRTGLSPSKVVPCLLLS